MEMELYKRSKVRLFVNAGPGRSNKREGNKEADERQIREEDEE